MDLDMFYNETTGEVKFYRGGAAKMGLGPEWEPIGVASINFTVYTVTGVAVPTLSEDPLGHPKQ